MVLNSAAWPAGRNAALITPAEAPTFPGVPQFAPRCESRPRVRSVWMIMRGSGWTFAHF